MNMTQDASTLPHPRDNPLEFKIERILVPLDFSAGIDGSARLRRFAGETISRWHPSCPRLPAGRGVVGARRRTSPVAVSGSDRTA